MTTLLKKIAIYILKTFFSLIIRLYSSFIKQNKNQVLFYPNLLSYKDFIDVKNYTCEGVLVYFNYLIKRKKIGLDKDYEYILVYYQNYQKDIPRVLGEDGNPCYDQIYYPVRYTHFFRYMRDMFNYYNMYFKSHIIITGNPMGIEKLKKRHQFEFCISYYVPFKNDFKIAKRNSNINYVFSGSKIASQIDSIATRIPFERYVPVGLPKWESLLSPRYTKEKVFSFFPYLNLNSKIIIYAPTHRDYELYNFSARGIFGEKIQYDNLNLLLANNNTFLFVKLHIGQNRSVIHNMKEYSNIKFLNSSTDYNLYDLLPYTDLLICDYTSTYFDYLVLKRPVIFYWYDYDRYVGTRGLSWEPIDCIIEGKIAYTYNELVDYIKQFLEGVYTIDTKKIEHIKSLMLGNNDNLDICRRIYEFIKAHS